MLNPYIKTFVQTADCGSFSSAAENLYISKVSVMNQINALEKDIGVALFQRTNHGVNLTDAGRSFYKNAKKLIRLADNAIIDARQTQNVIRVGTSMLRSADELFKICDEIGKSDFKFDVVSFSDGFNSLETMLRSLGDSIDCFINPGGSMNLLSKYNFLQIGVCRCCVAMSREHRLSKKNFLTWKDLENESLLLLKRGDSHILDEMRDEILRDHSTIKIVDFDGFYDLSAFNLCNQHQFLMETLDIWQNLHPSLITLPVEWKYEMPYGIFYSKNPSRLVEKFISSVENQIHK